MKGLYCRFALEVLLFVEGRRPGLRPGGRLTFFVSPKKVSKERRPDVHALLRRVRCAAQLGRGLAKLAIAQTDASTESLFNVTHGPRWSAIGMSGWPGCAAWARAHASSWGAQSPDFAPTLRAVAFSGGLRRCGACR